MRLFRTDRPRARRREAAFLAELMWRPASVWFVPPAEMPPNTLGFAWTNPKTGRQYIFVAHHADHDKMMLETAGHEAAHFIVPHLSPIQRAILMRELPARRPMPNAEEDLVERIGCWCAANLRREQMPQLSPQAARIMRDISIGVYWIRQKQKLEPAIIVLALLPVFGIKVMMVVLLVCLIAR